MKAGVGASHPEAPGVPFWGMGGWAGGGEDQLSPVQNIMGESCAADSAPTRDHLV